MKKKIEQRVITNIKIIDSYNASYGGTGYGAGKNNKFNDYRVYGVGK